ncbi:MAG: hypothetical protein Kow0090_11190 [Myxococcota bacterium]
MKNNASEMPFKERVFFDGWLDLFGAIVLSMLFSALFFFVSSMFNMPYYFFRYYDFFTRLLIGAFFIVPVYLFTYIGFRAFRYKMDWRMLLVACAFATLLSIYLKPPLSIVAAYVVVAVVFSRRLEPSALVKVFAVMILCFIFEFFLHNFGHALAVEDFSGVFVSENPPIVFSYSSRYALRALMLALAIEIVSPRRRDRGSKAALFPS